LSRISNIEYRVLAFTFVFLTLPSLAATNVSAGDDIPKLRPPRPELPPTFWEKYEIWVILGSIAVLALIGVIVWLATRPKPPVIIPPEVRAKQALDLLLIKPEDGLILSQVSQIIRHYVTEAFGLPPGEQTTAEFCRLTSTHERIGPELSSAIADFLRRCDERKFVASPPTAPMGAVATALKLVETAQMRLAELRRQSELTSAQ
jgi:hypothetical protein